MRIYLLFLIICVFSSSNLLSADLGKRGKTYSIIEVDLLDFIDKRARSVDWKAIFDREAERLRKEVGIVNHPINKALDNKTKYYDPTTTLDHDIIITDNITGRRQVVYPKGFIYNPLDYHRSNEIFIILNGKRQVEIDWFIMNYSNNLNVKPMLTEGNVLDLAETYQIPFTKVSDNFLKKFNIDKTPTVMYQERNLMRQDEYAIE